VTGPGDEPRTIKPAATPDDGDGASIDAPVTPVAQEKTDGPMDSAEFAERLDMNPDEDDVKG
jgi:hypothetical protein